MTMMTSKRTRRQQSPLFSCVLLVLLVSTLARAQQPEADTGSLRALLPVGVEAFDLSHRSYDQLTAILELLGIHTPEVSWIGSTAIVRFEHAADAFRARNLWERLNAPPRRIAITLQLVVASDEVVSEGMEVTSHAVLEQMKKTFRFKRYEETGRGRLIVDSGEEGTLTLGKGVAEYRLNGVPSGKMVLRTGARGFARVLPVYVGDGKGVIRLKGLEIFRGRLDSGKPPEALFTTSLNIKNGDSVVIGGTDIGDNAALIAIVTAETID